MSSIVAAAPRRHRESPQRLPRCCGPLCLGRVLYHPTFVSLVRLRHSKPPLSLTANSSCISLSLTAIKPLSLTIMREFQVAKRLTPIERLASGEPLDRHARFRQRMRDKGLYRATVMVPVDRVDELRALCARWVAEVRHDD